MEEGPACTIQSGIPHTHSEVCCKCNDHGRGIGLETGCASQKSIRPHVGPAGGAAVTPGVKVALETSCTRQKTQHPQTAGRRR
eukprot:365584-Chlamydomonas_euryale.AAC.15